MLDGDELGADCFFAEDSNREASPRLELRSEYIHVFSFSLDKKVDEGLDILDATERSRAARYIRESDRQRFVSSHWAVRQILAVFLKCDPKSIGFRTGELGKPELDDNALGVHFNLSHSGNGGLLAVSLGVELGIDIEQHRPMDYLAMAQRFFAEAEWRALLAMPEAEQPEGFFRCWTRKEAFVKMLGQGITYPMSSFQVSLESGDSEQLLLRCDASPNAIHEWRLIDLATEDGYSAALATRRGGWKLARWKLVP